MPNRSASIKDAQSEIKRLETLKQEIMGKMPSPDSVYGKMLRKAFQEEIDQIDKKITVAKKTLATATSAADLVDQEALSQPKPERRTVGGFVPEESKKKKRKFGDIFGDVLGDAVDKYVKEETGDADLGNTAGDIVGDIFDGGGKKEVGKKIKGRLRNLLGNKVDDLIEKEIGDEDVAAALKGVAETAINEGANKKELGKRLKAELKDLLGDKVGDLVDKKIKDEDVAEALSDIIGDVADAVVEGDFSKLKGQVGGRLKELAGDKLEDLIDKEIKDEDLRDGLKAIVEDAKDGITREELGKRLKTELKNLLGDKAGDLIDKKIKDADMAEALKGIIGDVTEIIVEGGDLKDLKFKASDRLKKLLGAKIEDLIEKEVKDEEIAAALKDILNSAVEGESKAEIGKRIKARLKELLGDKVGALIDEKIADDRIADVLKEIFGELLDGDWEGALDAAKDGVAALAKDELDKIIVKFMPEAEVFVIKHLETVLQKHVKGLITKAFGAVRKKLDSDMLVGQFVTNVTERILKVAIDIIQEEIVKYIKTGGLQRILSVAKDAAIDEIVNNLVGFKLKDISFKNIWLAIKEKVSNDPHFKQAVEDIKEKLLMRFIIIIEEEVQNVFGLPMDAFLLRYANWNGSLLNTGKRDLSITFYGCISIVASIQAELSAHLNTKRTKGQLKATAKGKVAGTAYLGIGLNIGVYVPLIGDLSIEGGIQGGPQLSGSAAISLGLKHGVMTGSMVPAQLNIDLVARYYLQLPSIVPDAFFKEVPRWIPGTSASASQNTIYLSAGEPVNMFIMTTPSYDLSFDMVKGKFKYLGSNGKYFIQLHPAVKRQLSEMVDGIKAAAERLEKKYNPIEAIKRIDWNPFD
jgi:hypothetical protein